MINVIGIVVVLLAGVFSAYIAMSPPPQREEPIRAVQHEVIAWMESKGIKYERILWCREYTYSRYCRVVFEDPREPASLIKCDNVGCYKQLGEGS